MSLCQSYERREITEVKWIHEKNVIETNRINISTTEWVEQVSMKQASTEQACTGISQFYKELPVSLRR